MVQPAAPLTDESSSDTTERVGSYVLVRRLGSGGMAEVWLGRHVTSGGIAAVKRLAPSPRKPVAIAGALLAREARVITRLEHPHVVPLFEFGEGFVVMPYIEGPTLARRMATPIAPAVAVRIARQIGSALAHAHGRGVVHRDVKPSNILLDRNETAFLSDFGVASLTGDAGARIAGTPRYMAPEQVRGEQVGPAADQFALALTLLEVLAGGRLGSDLAVAVAELPEVVPAALRAAIARAVAPAPADRFPSVAGFTAALAAIDLTGVPATPRLADPARPSDPRSWLARPLRHVVTAAELTRGDYRVRALVEDGRLDRAQAERLLGGAALADLGFSVHVASTRLGALDDPAALARVTEVIVLVHGWSSTRNAWRLVAPALCRDNGQALVLVPDLYGFGESTYACAPDRVQASPRMTAETALGLARLLGLGDLPTVVVAHSVGAMGLLSLDDRELPAHVTRVAVCPILLAYDSRIRWLFRIGAWAAATVGRIRWLRRYLAIKLGQVPAMLQLEAGDNEEIIANHLDLPTAYARRHLAAMARVRLKVGRQRRVVLIAGDDDPVAGDQRVVTAAAEDLGLDRAHYHRLASGGHTPQLPLAHRPEWTARNVDEICRIVQAMIVTAHEPTITRGDASDPTV